MHYKVYLILAHKESSQLKELIFQLEDEASFFFIHIDKKVGLDYFKQNIKSTKSFFVKNRIKCEWGNYTLVQATLNSLQEIKNFMGINHPNDTYHCIMLSGEDLPIKSNSYISSFLEEKRDVSFINHWKLPYNDWWSGGFFRFESLYLFNSVKYPKMHYWMNRIIKTFKLNFLIPVNQFRNKMPNFEFYGNSQWIILSEKMITNIVNFSSKNTEFNKLFKYVLAPDELYFPSLIYHFQIDKICKIENIKTHLIIFKGNNPNPQYLTVEEVKENLTDEMLFARKFDKNKNQETIDFVRTLNK